MILNGIGIVVLMLILFGLTTWDGDMELCFAKAHVALKEWLCDHNGGY